MTNSSELSQRRNFDNWRGPVQNLSGSVDTVLREKGIHQALRNESNDVALGTTGKAEFNRTYRYADCVVYDARHGLLRTGTRAFECRTPGRLDSCADSHGQARRLPRLLQ